MIGGVVLFLELLDIFKSAISVLLLSMQIILIYCLNDLELV